MNPQILMEGWRKTDFRRAGANSADPSNCFARLTVEEWTKQRQCHTQAGAPKIAILHWQSGQVDIRDAWETLDPGREGNFGSIEKDVNDCQWKSFHLFLSNIQQLKSGVVSDSSQNQNLERTNEQTKTKQKNKKKQKQKQEQKTNRNDCKDSTKLKEWRVILNTFSKFQMFTWSFHLIVIVKRVGCSMANGFLRRTICTEKVDLLHNPTKQFGMRSTIIHQKWICANQSRFSYHEVQTKCLKEALSRRALIPLRFRSGRSCFDTTSAISIFPLIIGRTNWMLFIFLSNFSQDEVIEFTERWFETTNWMTQHNPRNVEAAAEWRMSLRMPPISSKMLCSRMLTAFSSVNYANCKVIHFSGSEKANAFADFIEHHTALKGSSAASHSDWNDSFQFWEYRKFRNLCDCLFLFWISGG
jgi:hypothetical protein